MVTGFFKTLIYQHRRSFGGLDHVLELRFAPALLLLALCRAGRYLSAMKVAEIRDLVERQPFRPFGVRLNNGAHYTFKDSRDVGAPKDYRLLIYFGKSEAVRIDTDSIVEIFER
ncbi:MAG TPA: hypothetical protein VIL39_03975 [Verrucomicrobiae bacterium]